MIVKMSKKIWIERICKMYVPIWKSYHWLAKLLDVQASEELWEETGDVAYKELSNGMRKCILCTENVDVQVERELNIV